MELTGMSKEDLDNVEELKKVYGYEVVNAGFTCTIAEAERTVTMCYWRSRRGVRESALFPNHEAAWRDLIRTHQAAVDEVKAMPNVHRVARRPQAEADELNRLKKSAEEQGYEFRTRRGEHAWIYNGLTEAGHNSMAECVRGAIRHWARRDPESFVNVMNAAGRGEEPSSIHDDKPLSTFTVGGGNEVLKPLTVAELAKLQGFPGFNEMPVEHKALTVRAKQIINLMSEKGIKFDMSLLAGTVEEAACVAYKSQGKTFEEVEEDQRRATRAYGVVTGSLEEGQLRTLECCGYSFVFTSTKGWTCPSIENCKASGALETVVKEAWQHAIDNGGIEADMLATAKAYMGKAQ